MVIEYFIPFHIHSNIEPLDARGAASNLYTKYFWGRYHNLLYRLAVLLAEARGRKCQHLPKTSQ